MSLSYHWQRLQRWLHRRFDRDGGTPTIGATADGFMLRRPDGTVVEVPWASIRRAAACKRDLYTTDAIMLLLECDPPAPALLELSETWPGFATLFEGMEQSLGISPAWYIEIMLPVFEPTPRLLYERAGTAPGFEVA